MSHFAASIDPSGPNTDHAQVMELVGRGKKVLEVWCRKGDLGAVLAQQQDCVVDGFAADQEAADVAATRLEHVVVGDLEQAPLSTQIEAASYDVVVFADVLEHLADPAAVLRDAVSLLKPQGRIVISVPNVGHGSIRLALLQGRWPGTATPAGSLGLTRDNLLALVREAGLTVEELRGTIFDPLDTEVEIDEDNLPEHVVEWVRDQPGAYVDRFQLAARPARDGDPLRSAPELVPAVPIHLRRPQDAHSDARVQAGRDALTMRDHILGLQAAATAAQHRSEILTVRLEKVRARLERQRAAANARDRDLRARIAGLEQDLARTQAGFSAFARSAFRRLRRS